MHAETTLLGGSHGQVAAVEPDAVLLEVVNAPGPRSTYASGLGSGRGLVGMRERVRLYGGDLAVGPTEEGGFRVHARLPRAAG